MPSGLKIEEETRLKLFRLQVEMREFEKRVQQLFLQTLVKNMHLRTIGQEAVAARVSSPRSMTTTICFARIGGHKPTCSRVRHPDDGRAVGTLGTIDGNVARQEWF